MIFISIMTRSWEEVKNDVERFFLPSLPVLKNWWIFFGSAESGRGVLLHYGAARIFTSGQCVPRPLLQLAFFLPPPLLRRVEHTCTRGGRFFLRAAEGNYDFMKFARESEKLPGYGNVFIIKAYSTRGKQCVYVLQSEWNGNYRFVVYNYIVWTNANELAWRNVSWALCMRFLWMPTSVTHQVHDGV